MSFSHSPKQNVKHCLHFLHRALKDKACSDFCLPYNQWKIEKGHIEFERKDPITMHILNIH